MGIILFTKKLMNKDAKVLTSIVEISTYSIIELYPYCTYNKYHRYKG